MINAFSVDVEDWFQRIEIPCEDYPLYENRIWIGIQKLLKIIRDNKVDATFFVLAYVAENFPNVIEKITDEGHEIACHGYCHLPIYKQTCNEFGEDLRKALGILRKLTNERILGYRAPCFSVTKKTSWAINIMEKIGIKYDSSVFPIRTHLYGVPNAPRHPYRPSKEDITKNDPNRNFIEFPLSTYRFIGINIPISGGFYLRFLPFSLIKRCLRSLNKKGKPAIVYVHPWELDPDQPNLRLPYKERFIHYHNLRNTEKKIRILLRDFRFSQVREVLSL